MLEPGKQLDGIPAIISNPEGFIWSRDSVSHRGSPELLSRLSCAPTLCPPKWGEQGGRASLNSPWLQDVPLLLLPFLNGAGIHPVCFHTTPVSLTATVSLTAALPRY